MAARDDRFPHPSLLTEPRGLEPLALATAEGLRICHVAEPDLREARPQSLILGFHGGGGGAPRFAMRSGMAEALIELGQGSVYPQARSHWADGRTALEAGWADDLALIETLRERAGPLPMAAVGVSNGGMFALRLACELTPPLKAVVAVTAAMPADYFLEAPWGPPVPVMLVQAPMDPIIPWDGGEMPRAEEDSPGGRLLSADETLGFWLRRNRCEGAPRKRQGFIGSMGVEISVWSGGADVWRVVLLGAGHGWPVREPGAPLHGSLEEMVARFLVWHCDRDRLTAAKG